MKLRRYVGIIWTFFLAISASGQSQTQTIQTRPAFLPCTVRNNLPQYLDADHASIFDPGSAGNLIAQLLGSLTTQPVSRPQDVPLSGPNAPDVEADYFILHVLRWSKAEKAEEGRPRKATVQAQNWYVYHSGGWYQQNFLTTKRVFGAKRIWFVYVHLSDPTSGMGYQARYEITITKKEPANVANLFTLLQTFQNVTSVEGKLAPPCPEDDVWGAGEILANYVPSDVTIIPKKVDVNSDGTLKETSDGLGDPQTFDNEGKYWWDVSIGVPVRRIRELSFDDTANTVTAKNVDKQNIFGLLNLYYPKVDVKDSNYGWIPHFVGGVSIAKQPLHGVLLAAGFGPHFANFYIGALRVVTIEPSTLHSGDSATPSQFSADLHKRTHWQISLGLNLPVKGIQKTLQKATK